MRFRTPCGWAGAVRFAGVLVTAGACAAESPVRLPQGTNAPPPAKARVTFSDAEDGKARVDVATPGRLFGGRPDSLKQGSSLDAVAAPPFSPPLPIFPGSVPRRDRDGRDTRSNWLTDPGSSLTISEENVHRAFGVRPNDFTDPDKRIDQRSSIWSSFMQQPDTPQASRPESALDNPGRLGRNKEPLDRYAPSQLTGLEERPQAPNSRDRDRVLFSDTTSWNGPYGRRAEDASRERPDLVREHLDLTAVPATPRNDARSALRAEQFRRILGVGPGTESDAARPWSGSVGSPAVRDEAARSFGSSDLVNMAPDPTRSELNPVIGRAAPELGKGAGLTFADTLSTPRPNAIGPRRSVLDPGPLSGFGPSRSSAAATLENQVRRPLLGPTKLDVPRRGF